MPKQKIELDKKSKPKLTQETKVIEKETIGSQQKLIHSHELLRNGKEVFIQHNGEQYLLRCTRNGKLILTK